MIRQVSHRDCEYLASQTLTHDYILPIPFRVVNANFTRGRSSTTCLLVMTILLTSTPSKKVYQCHLHGPSHPPLLLKHRFAKQYRHPTLDNSLTKGRVAGEARMLLRCLRNGVRVPGVRMVDTECGILGLEWIEGRSVRTFLGVGEMMESDNESELEETGEEAQDHSLASRSEIGAYLPLY